MPTKTIPHYHDERYWYEDHSGGTVLGPYLNGTYRKIGDNSVTTSGPVPNYRRLIATGQNATSALTGTEWRKTGERASCDYSTTFLNPNNGTNSYKYKLYGNMMSYFLGQGTDSSLTVASSFLAEADSQARASFYQRLAEAQTQFKGAVFTGELRESLQMIRNPAQALRRGISDYLDRLKKGAPRRARRDRPRFVRDTWLEYSFGWRPLISDLEDGITAFYTSKWPKPVFTMIRSRGRAGGQPTLGPLQGVSAGVQSTYLQWQVESSRTAEVKYYGIYRSTGTGPSQFRHFGFSPWEFVPTLWELVPYSFLVDYFTNIGEILSAWSYRNIGCEWAAKGYKLANRAQIRNAKIVLGEPNIHKFLYNTGDPGSSSVEYALRVREPSVSIPLPDFRFQVPGMGVKWVNILALTNQLGSTRRSLAS